MLGINIAFANPKKIRRCTLGYYKANDILPPEILEKLQEYIDGEYLYIPRKLENRKLWGEETDTRKVFSERNIQIYKEFLEGNSIRQLSDKYFLAEKSIQRIIRQQRQK